MAKRLEALIAQARRAKRPRDQKEVAFGLADLSTHEELHDRIVKKGGVVSLMVLIEKTQDAEAQRFAALGLANCASAVYTRERMVEEGAHQLLVKLCSNEDGDLVARQYAAMALGNLAADPTLHEEMVKIECIDALISLLKVEEVESGRYAAFALSNLAANANHRDQIVDEGAVPALVTLACVDAPHAQRQALTALRGLCITPAHRITVVKSGVLDPLVLMARSDDISVLREVGSALNCLSSAEENKMEIADRCMATILAMMLHVTRRLKGMLFALWQT